MKPFLKSVAEQVFETFGDDIVNTEIVVPGKRAGLFLKKYLAETFQRSFLAPRIVTLPEFTSGLIEKPITSRLELLLLLYKVYRKRLGENAEPFDTFSKWATTALSDFSDIEQSLVSGSTLFKDLRDIKEIENWSFHQQTLSEAQQHYLEFWNQLGGIYTDFRTAQLAEDKYSYALICHTLAKGTPAALLKDSVRAVWFTGLSHLSVAENKILQKLSEAGKARIIWDADPFYLDNPIHEAGSFLRNHAQREDILLTGHFAGSGKHISAYETTTPYSQALLVKDLIRKTDPSEMDRTAIILADQNVLLPLIKNLPPIDNKINIALGYPLRQTAVFKLLRSLLQLHIPQPGKEKRGTYYKNILRVIEQQSLNEWLGNEIRDIRATIIKEKRTYFRNDHLQSFVSSFPALHSIAFIFHPENKNPDTWLENVIRLLDILPAKNNDEFERECILRAQDILAEIRQLISVNGHFGELRSVQVFLQHLLSQEAIAFTGEPLEGLQILSMVETRAIDFRNIIIVGANEDQLPGNLQDTSLIPFDVRKIFGMPTVVEKETTYSYTLYRLLQRAENINFLYSSITADFKGTEQSRYITQIELELSDYNPGIQFRKIKASLPIDSDAIAEIKAVNDDFTRQRIEKLWASGISPSALNKYLTCPLDFYYRYILGLGEEEEIEENISASTFGSAVHEVLEEFFVQFLNGFPSEEELQAFRDELPALLRVAFKNHYGLGELDYGENYLQFSLALRMLETIVDFEQKEMERRKKENTVCRIEAIESSFEADIDHERLGIPFPMKIRGKADRVDREQGFIRIIDYKTGSVEAKDVTIDTSVRKTFEKASGKTIQLLFYTYMLASQGHAPENIRAALFSLKKFSSGWQYLSDGQSQALSGEMLDEFEEQLALCAREMIECSHFSHNPESRYCEYCMR